MREEWLTWSNRPHPLPDLLPRGEKEANQNSASNLTPITSRNAAMTVPSTRWRFSRSGKRFASKRPSGLRKTKQMTMKTTT